MQNIYDPLLPHERKNELFNWKEDKYVTMVYSIIA